MNSAVTRASSAAIADRAVLPLGLPNGDSITVTLSQPYTDPGARWTTIDTESPLLATTIDGKDHLEIRVALDVVGKVLTRHLMSGAFDDA